MKVSFEIARAQTRAAFICAACGKRSKRQKSFWQSVNPFNKNANGTPKTRAQVQADVSAEATAWRKSVTLCAACDACSGAS